MKIGEMGAQMKGFIFFPPENECVIYLKMMRTGKGIWFQIWPLWVAIPYICSMGLKYLPTFGLDVWTFHVGKYSSPMEHLGMLNFWGKKNRICPDLVGLGFTEGIFLKNNQPDIQPCQPTVKKPPGVPPKGHRNDGIMNWEPFFSGKIKVDVKKGWKGISPSAWFFWDCCHLIKKKHDLKKTQNTPSTFQRVLFEP